MGVLNVTPDSFSDGGLYDTYERAVARGLEMMAEGADVVDVGGESSRPGAEPVPADVELARVVPVVEALAHSPAAAERGVRVSVDTVEARGGRGRGRRRGRPRQRHLGLAVGRGRRHRRRAGWPCTCRARPRTMQADPRYADVVAEVSAFVVDRADAGAPGRGARGLDRPRDRLRQDRRPTTCRCCGTCPSWSRPVPAPGAPGSWSAPAASGSSACSEGATGWSRHRWSTGSRRRWPRQPAAMVAGVGMVRVHDVAATVQVARLYGRASGPPASRRAISPG